MTRAQLQPLPPISDEEEARIQAGIAQDADNPEMTDEELAAMRPARDVLPPELFSALAHRGSGRRGRGKRPAEVQLTLRIDPEALAAWRRSGEGWQARMNDVLVREAPKPD